MSFDAADVWVRTNLWALSTDGKNQVSLSRDAQVRAVRKPGAAVGPTELFQAVPSDHLCKEVVRSFA